jgi:BlaI family transcriptional regulator, penicillinase repressor
MKDMPKISEAEWVIMQVLWARGGLTANEIVARLEGKVQWNPRTIRTLINRLLNKRAIRFDKQGREYRYSPAVSEEQCTRYERLSFLGRVYRGATKPMLAAFLEEAKLSKKDIAELKAILEEKGKGT